METLTSVIVCLILLAVQLLLCFKAKKLIVKLIPAAILLIALAVFVVLTMTSSGWNALGYIAFVLLISIYLIPCGVAWLIWLVYIFIKKRKA